MSIIVSTKINIYICGCQCVYGCVCVWMCESLDCMHGVCVWMWEFLDCMHGVCEWMWELLDCMHGLCEWMWEFLEVCTVCMWVNETTMYNVTFSCMIYCETFVN